MNALRGVEVVELGSRVRSLTRKPLIVQSRSRYLHHLAPSVIAYHLPPQWVHECSAFRTCCLSRPCFGLWIVKL